MFGHEEDTLFYLDTPPLWENITNLLVRASRKVKGVVQKFVLGVIRGIGKTTWITEAFGLWRLFEDNRSLTLIITHAGKEEEIWRDIESLVSSKRFLRHYYKSADPKVVRGSVWSKTEGTLSFRVPIKNNDGGAQKYREAYVRVRSWGQPVFGTKEKASRIDTLILDDTTTWDEARVPEAINIAKNKVARFRAEHVPSVTTRDRYGRAGMIVIIDTPKTDVDFFCRAMKFRGYRKIILPAVVQTPSQSKLAGVPIGESVWEEMKPLEGLLADKVELEEHTYATQYDIKPKKLQKGVDFFPKDIIEQHMITREELDSAFSRAKEGHVAVTFDAAYTKESHSDYCGITLAFHTNGRIYFIRSIRDYWDQDALWGQLLVLQREAKAICRKNPRITFKGIFIEERQGATLVNLLTLKNKLAVIEKKIPAGDGVDVRSIKKYSLLTEISTRANSLSGVVVMGQVYFLEGQNTPLTDEMDAWKGFKEKGGNEDVLDAGAYQTSFMTLIEEDEEKPEEPVYQPRSSTAAIEQLERQLPGNRVISSTEKWSQDNGWISHGSRKIVNPGVFIWN
jgi:hypothetical protein